MASCKYESPTFLNIKIAVSAARAALRGRSRAASAGVPSRRHAHFSARAVAHLDRLGGSQLDDGADRRLAHQFRATAAVCLPLPAARY